MTDKYILDEHKNPVPVEDLKEWAKAFEGDNRTVAKTKVGDAHVSTVFLALDHRFGGDGPPLLFETMIFGGQHDQWQARYSTWDEAERGHFAVVGALANGLPPQEG